MADARPPVPAVPSVVLALGASLQGRLDWLAQRFRAEIGPLYPASLLRFRLLRSEEEVTPEALHALCDPLLVHPLWLGLQERGLAPGGEEGPRLRLYAITSDDDAQGGRLLAPLAANLQGLYPEQLLPDLFIFHVGPDIRALPRLEETGRPLPCFLLGAVKQYGYRTAGRDEPYEAIRLALNAFLTSGAADEVEARLAAGAGHGLAPLALGASAVAVARGPMEAWVRNRAVQRLAKACLAGVDEEEPPLVHAARAAVAGALGLVSSGEAADEPDELWARGLGRRVGGLARRWANEVLRAWGVEMRESRRGQWRLVAQTEGDLHRRLQRLVVAHGEGLEEAEAALTQEVVRLANALRRHFARRERELLTRWRALPMEVLGSGPGCLARLEAIVAAAEAGLERAAEALKRQRLQPVWLRGDREAIILAGALGAQMMPARCAAERTQLSFVPAGWVALRMLPLVLLVGAAAADLHRRWGLPAGLALGLSFVALAAALQVRALRRSTYGCLRDTCRLYESTIGGLALAEAQSTVRRLQEAVAVSAAQLRAVAGELAGLAEAADEALSELWRPQEGNYLERQLADPSRCAAAAGGVAPEELLAVPPGEEAGASPAGLLAAALRGDLPAEAMGAGLAEAVGASAARACAPIETRIEEVLVSGRDGPFSPAATLEGLHQRALPLCPRGQADGPEVALAIMSRQAAVAFRGCLAEHADGLRLLPTLQRDRISYLRLRRLGG